MLSIPRMWVARASGSEAELFAPLVVWPTKPVPNRTISVKHVLAGLFSKRPTRLRLGITNLSIISLSPLDLSLNLDVHLERYILRFVLFGSNDPQAKGARAITEMCESPRRKTWLHSSSAPGSLEPLRFL